jgi:hypothetical protein
MDEDVQWNTATNQEAPKLHDGGNNKQQRVSFLVFVRMVATRECE